MFVIERGVVYSRLLYCLKSSVEVPCVRVLCGQVSGLEILLCEGGDVELCARTSKHIRMLTIDPLSLSLSLFYIVPCINSYCHIILICLVVIVCVPHLCLTTRASYSTSTLIQRNQEELVQSPSPRIRLHSLVTLSVLQLVFNFRILFIRLVVHLFTPPLGVLTGSTLWLPGSSCDEVVREHLLFNLKCKLVKTERC